mgnify:CR=1 FL=1
MRNHELVGRVKPPQRSVVNLEPLRLDVNRSRHTSTEIPGSRNGLEFDSWVVGDCKLPPPLLLCLVTGNFPALVNHIFLTGLKANLARYFNFLHLWNSVLSLKNQGSLVNVMHTCHIKAIAFVVKTSFRVEFCLD